MSTEGTIGVRPPKHLRAALRKLAKDRQTTEGKILYQSAEAIIAMIDAAEPRIPWLVTSTRVLRQHGATATDPERPFAADHLILHEPPTERPRSKSAVAHSKTSK